MNIFCNLSPSCQFFSADTFSGQDFFFCGLSDKYFVIGRKCEGGVVTTLAKSAVAETSLDSLVVLISVWGIAAKFMTQCNQLFIAATCSLRRM